MHIQSALKSSYKYNFQFAGEKIGRKSPSEYRINSLYVHYRRWFIIFLAGPQLITSLRSTVPTDDIEGRDTLELLWVEFLKSKRWYVKFYSSVP